MRKIGITTTIPVEIIYASNSIPVDLNNIFITSKNPDLYVLEAERNGFPRTTCAWIKGLFSVALHNNIKEIIAVMEGDCSNTHALSEVYQMHSLKIIPFSFPYSKNYNFLKTQIEFLMKYFNVSWEKVYKIKNYLDSIRKKLKIIDTLTYSKNIVSGFENHLFLVSSSDFKGNPEKFSEEIDIFLKKIKKRKPFRHKIRLGFIGVPPIILNLYQTIEKFGARIVFNEIQRQFAMLSLEKDIVKQYLIYTYPYSVFDRIKDIKTEIKKRKIHGIIHYVQSFCFRAIEDSIFKKYIDIPILTLEGDKPQNLDERSKIRLESFIDMLKFKLKKLN